MFQLPLLGSALQGLAKGDGTGHTQPGGGLMALLQANDGEMAGFGGELQALLMQFSPEALQRFDQLLGGGMSLPQAANTLLDEFTAEGLDGPFSNLLKQFVGDGKPLSAVAPGVIADAELAASTARSRAAKPIEGLLTGHGMAHLAPTSFSAALTQLSLPAQQSMSPQLTSSLLDMGVPQQVGAKGWSNAVSDRVMWMVQGDQQFARLKLNPPNLGPLEVRVSINQDQTSVAFLAQHAAVREALEAAIPRLREMFDQASLQLVRADVSDPGAGQGGRPDDAGGEAVAGSRFWSGDDATDSDNSAQPPGIVSATSLVDLFA